MGERQTNVCTRAGTSIVILPDAESLSLAAATAIVARARRAFRTSGGFTLALSGGSTPQRTYGLLAAPPFREMLPWEATHVFWSDERCVEATDPRSNEGMARRALLDHVRIPAEQVHPMTCPSFGGKEESPPGGEGSPPGGEVPSGWVGAADDYEGMLRSFFRGAGPAATDADARPFPARTGLDLVLLGLGVDGHIASLFPGSPALGERGRWALACDSPAVTVGPGTPGVDAATVGVADSVRRITLTPAFMNRATVVLFLVSGASKAAAVKRALEGSGDPQALPARLIQPVGGGVCWLLDEDAASRLEELT